ncbi:MAG: hypothetical protein R6W78_15050 [Bacteroidales bacterium]
MTYNWPEILKNKTDKELYDIYLGKTFLPKEVQQLSKQELIIRNFDFNNIEKHKLAWQLASIVEEETHEKLGDNRSKFAYIKFSHYVVIIIVFLILSLFVYFLKQEHSIINVEFILLGVAFISLGSILSNFLHKKEKAYISKRNSKRNQIVQQLKKDNLLNRDNPIIKDILRHSKTNSEIKKIQENIGGVFVYLILISIIIIAFCFLNLLWASIISTLIFLFILMSLIGRYIEKKNN